MPSLHWIGKEKVINHHLDVPYRFLEHKYGFNNGVETAEPCNRGSKIIHGDNLEALKSLLPEYEAKIKCIYIDPPYNTGNENWVYNDNVSDPKLKKWLGQVVGKEAEDLTRHDKWLCMMYPRLVLLHKLLAEDGVIFISIDDNEHVNLKLVCDEIFGRVNFVSSLVWRRRASSQMAQNNISVDHEYIVSYFKSQKSKFNGLKKDYKNYSNTDNDPRGNWTLGDLTVGMTKDQRPNQYYELVDPDTGRVFPPSPKRVWTYSPETMAEKINERRVIFPKSKTGQPMLKRFLSELKSDINPLSSWLNNESYAVGLNSEGTKIIQTIFPEKVFDYPKPNSLLELLLSQVLSDNDLVLDSFAGSGTTAHAVLNLNRNDGGNRKFILLEMEDYAATITAERVKRVISGYGGKEGAGGSFDYYELGAALFDDEEEINKAASLKELRSYVYYTETRTALVENKSEDNKHLLGFCNGTAYYFFYEQGASTTLNYDFLSTMRTKAGQYVIYADNCLLSDEFMARHKIVFKKAPEDISKI